MIVTDLNQLNKGVILLLLCMKPISICQEGCLVVDLPYFQVINIS